MMCLDEVSQLAKAIDNGDGDEINAISHHALVSSLRELNIAKCNYYIATLLHEIKRCSHDWAAHVRYTAPIGLKQWLKEESGGVRVLIAYPDYDTDEAEAALRENSTLQQFVATHGLTLTHTVYDRQGLDVLYDHLVQVALEAG